jgi:Cdc6-like AAA superfamily ATPase
MTTSVEVTKDEIARFLKGNEPAVLCVTGEWGVGKTYLWRSVLDDLRKSNGLSLARYSYVSLFGLNSLDDVRASLFENMEWLDQDATNFSQRGKAGAKAIAARAKKLSELAGHCPGSARHSLKRARSISHSFRTRLFASTTLIGGREISN